MIIDWERWHDLLTIRDHRAMTETEKREYDEMLAVVVVLDAEDAAVSEAAMDKLEQKHDRIIASIDRLTDKLREGTK